MTNPLHSRFPVDPEIPPEWQALLDKLDSTEWRPKFKVARHIQPK